MSSVQVPTRDRDRQRGARLATAAEVCAEGPCRRTGQSGREPEISEAQQSDKEREKVPDVTRLSWRWCVPCSMERTERPANTIDLIGPRSSGQTSDDFVARGPDRSILIDAPLLPRSCRYLVDLSYQPVLPRLHDLTRPSCTHIDPSPLTLGQDL